MSTAPSPPATDDVLGGHDVSRRVVRGGTVRFVGYGLVNLMGVLSSALLLRHLGVVDYGRYGTVLSLVAIVSGLADAGLTVIGSRELALRAPGEERRRLLATMLGLRLALSSAFVVAGLLVALAAGYDNEMLVGVVLVGTGSVLLAAQVTIALPLAVELRNARLTASELIKQGLLLGGVILCVGLGAGLVPFFAIQVAIGLGSLAALPFLVGRHAFVRPRWLFDEWKELARTALPIAGALVLTVAYVRLLVVLASILTSAYQTGLFVTSARIVEMLGGIPLLISGVILPVAAVAARDDRGRLEYVLGRTTEISLMLGTITALVFVLAAEPITTILGGQAFAAAAPVLRLQAPAVVTIFLVQSWIAFLIADGHRRDLLRCVIIGLFAVIASGLVLIPLADARGAAAAAVIADVVYATAVYLAIRRLPGQPTPIHGPFLVRLIGALGAAAAVGLLVPLPQLPAAILAAAVFASLCVAMRMVPVDVWRAIPRFGR
jgi:O-antigen/teichoic acid export membrane protein